MAPVPTKEKKGGNNNERPAFYKLNAAELPDELFRKEVPVEEWIGTTDGGDGMPSKPWMRTTANPSGFRPGELREIFPVEGVVDAERCVGIALYMVGNVTPFVVPILLATRLIFDGQEWAGILLGFILSYQLALFAIERLYFAPLFLERYGRQTDVSPTDHKYSQYLFTERNTTKYCSSSYVWPARLHRPNMESTPVIYCMIPHGLAPYGVVGYPYWSKVWNDRLCSWTCAPVIFSLPVIGRFMKAIGYIPAKSKNIMWALQKKDRNVGVVLDGIAGMFHSSSSDGRNDEVGAILKRKGIIKIALRAGVPIVPVYGFGHTKMYDVYVDPFGIMAWLSKKLDVSITPFFGRWNWFMGPPKRDVPVTICLGDPIYPPKDVDAENITQEQIDEYHSKLLEGFTDVFETHKSGYYGGRDRNVVKKKLVFVE